MLEPLHRIQRSKEQWAFRFVDAPAVLTVVRGHSDLVQMLPGEDQRHEDDPGDDRDGQVCHHCDGRDADDGQCVSAGLSQSDWILPRRNVFSVTTNITPTSAASGICSMSEEPKRMKDKRSIDPVMLGSRLNAPWFTLIMLWPIIVQPVISLS